MRVRRVFYRPPLVRVVPGGHLSQRQKRGLLLIGLSAVLLVLLLSVSRNLVPVMTEMAINESYELVTTVVNEAINERLLDGSLSYRELVILERDASGNITALTTDMAQINILQATITNEVVARMSPVLVKVRSLRSISSFCPSPDITALKGSVKE